MDTVRVIIRFSYKIYSIYIKRCMMGRKYIITASDITTLKSYTRRYHLEKPYEYKKSGKVYSQNRDIKKYIKFDIQVVFIKSLYFSEPKVTL